MSGDRSTGRGVALAAGLLVILAADPDAGAAHTATPQGCEEAKRDGGWCEAAGVGYVAGVEIRSRPLFEALDAHGHDIVPEYVTCETCKKAMRTDGFCPSHLMGYVKGKAYLSPLTYQIARARRIDPATLTCPECRRHAQGIGWCEKDQVGIAGHLAIADRQAFSEFQKAYETLLAAIEVSARCETCAAAMVADGYCPTHRLKYKDGKPAPAS
ncbi:MAG TPA: hypothetical protein VFB95_07300 [Candidatus Cryosericum sp.]|nr:hypothetical protein [Candidatus Cryosericum sp.]